MLHAPAVPEGFFGVNALFVYARGDLSTKQRSALTAAIIASGPRWARVDLHWAAVEAKRDTLTWDALDARVRMLADNGIEPRPALHYNVPWNSECLFCKSAEKLMTKPRDYDEFVAYAKAVAARYAPGAPFWQTTMSPDAGITRFEIWNEPNNPGFWRGKGPFGKGGPNVADYASLLIQTARGIHEVQPSTEVIAGGLMGREADLMGTSSFLGQMFVKQPSLATALAGVGLHGYAASSPGAAATRIRVARRTLEETARLLNRPSLARMPIVLNEWGTSLPGGPHDVISDAARRRDYTKQLALYLAAARTNCGIDSTSPYTWNERRVTKRSTLDLGSLLGPGSTDHSGGFTLTNDDATLNSAGIGYRDAVLDLQGQAAKQPTDLPEAHLCDATTPPDTDGDSRPDWGSGADFYPLDPAR